MVTDNGGATAEDTVSITVEEPAPLPDIILSTNGYKKKGRHRVDLSWSGATAVNIDVYRDGNLITTTANAGEHTDNTGNRGKATYIYEVCDEGTTNCSNESIVIFN